MPIESDEIGNVAEDGTWRYTWAQGRTLAQMESTEDTLRFAYNAGGLRVRKESDITGVTEYTLSGKLVVHVTHRNTDLHFWYAGGTKPVVATYNGHDYGYVYNLQGDVIALADLEAEGTPEVVRYAYDAWGKPLSCEGPMAETLGRENPFRYRGYVYDEETGLYYLRTRYYNPEWGRFLSMDSVLGTMGELREHNLFMYCGNNPVDRVDEDGNAWAAVNDGGGSGPKTSSSSGSGWNGAEWWYYEQTGKDPRKPSGSSSSSGSVSYVQNGPVETDKVYRYEGNAVVQTQTDGGAKKNVEVAVYTGVDGIYYSILGRMVHESEVAKFSYRAQPDAVHLLLQPLLQPHEKNVWPNGPDELKTLPPRTIPSSTSEPTDYFPQAKKYVPQEPVNKKHVYRGFKHEADIRTNHKQNNQGYA